MTLLSTTAWISSRFVWTVLFTISTNFRDRCFIEGFPMGNNVMPMVMFALKRVTCSPMGIVDALTYDGFLPGKLNDPIFLRFTYIRKKGLDHCDYWSFLLTLWISFRCLRGSYWTLPRAPLGIYPTLFTTGIHSMNSKQVKENASKRTLCQSALLGKLDRKGTTTQKVV